MVELSAKFTELFWQSALGLIPLAIAVGLTVRFIPCRPATRHTLWLTLTVWLLVSPWLPAPPKLPDLDRQSNVDLAIVDRGTISDELHTEHSLAQSANEPTVSTWPIESSQTARENPPLASSWTTADWSTVNPTTSSHEEVTEARPWQDDNWTSFPRFVARPVPDPMDMLARGTDAGEPHSDLTLHEPAESMDQFCWEDNQLNLPCEKPAQSLDSTHNSIVVDRTILAQQPVSPFAETPSETESPATGLVHGITSAVAALVASIGPIRSVMPAWVSAAATIRDSILALPPIPIIVWASGLALVVVVKLISLAYFLRRVRASIKAPKSVLDLVSETSKQLGLKHPPETLMTEAKISPMVWCGRRPLLILPRELWQQLDRESKRAVICHELAHIRRKDHWVAWIETVVGAVYWWHPVVWCVRHQLHVEAENCCDAWVTWLYPTKRRAYAGALLATKKYIGMNESRAPVAGMQMTSGRAGRFARRLTMVMTKSIVPRLSMPGLTLAVALALSSWLTAPAWSCPKEAASAKPVKAVKLVADEQTPSVVMVTTPDSDETSATGGSSYAYYMASNDKNHVDFDQALKMYTNAGQSYVLTAGSLHREKLEQRLEELERQLAELGARLGSTNDASVAFWTTVGNCKNCATASGCAKCTSGGACANCAKGASCSKCAKSFGKDRALATVCCSGKCTSCTKAGCDSCTSKSFGRTSAPREPRIPRATRSPRTPRAPREPRVFQAPAVMEYVLPDMKALVAPLVFTPRDAMRSNSSFKRYELSTGKLKALIKLMSRSDVPIIIRPGDTSIQVQGGPDVQNLFRSFVSLIEPGEEKIVEYKLSKGKLEALIELMGRSDIPVMIEPTSQGIKVHGHALQQSVFRAFVDAIGKSNGRVSLFTPSDSSKITKRKKASKLTKQHRRKNEIYEHKIHEQKLQHAEELTRKTERHARRSIKLQQKQAEKLLRNDLRQERIHEHKRERQHRYRELKEKLHYSKQTNLDVEALHEHLSELMVEIPSHEMIESVKQALQRIGLKDLDFHEQREIIEVQARKLEDKARAMSDRALELAEQALELEGESDDLDSEASDLGDQAQELWQAVEDAKDDDSRARILAEHAALITQASGLHNNVNKMQDDSNELSVTSQNLEDQSQAYAMLAEYLFDTAQTYFDKRASE